MKNKKGQFKKSKELLDRKIFPNFFIFIILLTLGGCIGGNGSTSFKGILFGPTNNLLQSASINDSVSVNYSLSPYVLTKDLPIDPIQPSISGSIEQCSSNPTLPTGLVISGTCTITGTPTINQPATNYTITASNLSQSKSATIVITVNANPPAALNFATPTFTFTAGAMPGFAPIVPNYTGTITNCTSDIPLPTGLSLGTTNCSLSGSPSTTQGPTNYTITASNAFGSTSTIITITVNIAPPSALNYAGSPFVFTQDATIAAIHPTYTGTVTACNSDIPLPAGLTLGTTTCVISGTPNTIQPATHYNITASNASGSISFPITITVNLAPPSALSYAGTPFTFTQGATITTATPSVTGTVTSCNSDIPLPAGLGINGTTCAISGTPTTTQSATNYTITASNAYGSTNTTISIRVNLAPPSALSYAGTPFTFTQGATITTATPSVTGTVTSCNSDIPLPAGLGINGTTCAISGTPTTTQSATNYTITASNAYGSTNTTISITVNPAPPTGLAYTPSALVFYKGVAGAATPTVTGTVTSCNPNVALPGGLTLNATTCAISGTPTVFQASANYTITASNSSGNTNTTISIMIFGTPPMKTMQTNCWDATGTIDATCVTASSAGQDGKLQKGTNPSFTNQTVNTTEYITIDNNTGLVWKTCHEGRSGATCTTGSDNLFNLATAITACNNLNAGTGYANRTNWRVPIISELETLANFDATANPRTFTAVFPGTLSNRYYWSSTPYLPTAGYTLVLNFGDAGTNATQTNIAGTYLRCVSP
ncbi:putative Ig domain-containing protein [Leptospira interrogans]|uniref:PF07603 family protein n=2 Tax=Leptospira interrogans TaxID=173 RepID=M6KDU2_LEPIR|nr:putative Ig domain-containing protein [Leptospira interrogans]EMF74209.1 PF07603 family protein [Leptospira interrogans serovar Canicola str. LT1962]EMN32349.1 PF07603 family protein [Leptospira interrogans serovar Pyrogenes str. L0374]EMN71565.1 PF07603 family protein [Leptospira interrogans serovar Bataviae str. UI 08561]EJP03385.1 PF07603 family protein [Leptospira interrogans serovar Bulgarica str. Mallika]EKO04204.1 PF07603 family protein [Leptospira interrogans str. C10069]